MTISNYFVLATIAQYTGVIYIIMHTEKVIDFKSVELGKLRVKELKNILNGWGEDCRGCAEKSDYVSKINSVKHLHVEL